MAHHNGYSEDSVRLDAATLRMFYTKGRMLTPYALSCGYCEKAEPIVGATITLWKEHGTFHVRHHQEGKGRIFWDSFENISDARRRFKRALREAS